MFEGHAPDLDGRRVCLGESFALGVVDAEGIEDGRVVGQVVAVRVDFHASLGVGSEQGQNASVGGGNPRALVGVVVAHRYGRADRDTDEVVHVERDRLVEFDGYAVTAPDRFVRADFDAVGVADAGRQFGGHGTRSTVADGIFGEPEREAGGLGKRAVGLAHLGVCSGGNEQARGARSVGVRHAFAGCDLIGRGGAELDRDGNGGRRLQDDIVEHGPLPGIEMDRTVCGQQAVLAETDSHPVRTVHGQVERSVGPRTSRALLGMAVDRDVDVGYGTAGGIEHATMHRANAFGIEGVGLNIPLNGVRAGVEEFEHGRSRGDRSGRERRGGVRRVAR